MLAPHIITIVFAVLINGFVSLFSQHGARIVGNVKTFSVEMSDSVLGDKIGSKVNNSFKTNSEKTLESYGLEKVDNNADLLLMFSINKYSVDNAKEGNKSIPVSVVFDNEYKIKNHVKKKVLKNIEKKIEVDKKKINDINYIISKIACEYMKNFVNNNLLEN